MATMLLSGCFGGKSASSSGRGGEVVGVSGRGFKEPTPYGMTLVKRGSLRMGVEKQDSLWGKSMPVKDISVDGFWMDETEVTNSQYKQFVHWVRDSILRTRLADPSYGGDESYMITEDKNGDPVTPHLNWNKRLPRKPTEDELRAFESLYVTNPATGEKMLDPLRDLRLHGSSLAPQSSQPAGAQPQHRHYGRSQRGGDDQQGHGLCR